MRITARPAVGTPPATKQLRDEKPRRGKGKRQRSRRRKYESEGGGCCCYAAQRGDHGCVGQTGVVGSLERQNRLIEAFPVIGGEIASLDQDGQRWSH